MHLPSQEASRQANATIRKARRQVTDKSVDALLTARKHAVEGRAHDITPEHVLFGLASLPQCVA